MPPHAASRLDEENKALSRMKERNLSSHFSLRPLSSFFPLCLLIPGLRLRLADFCFNKRDGRRCFLSVVFSVSLCFRFPIRHFFFSPTPNVFLEVFHTLNTYRSISSLLSILGSSPIFCSDTILHRARKGPLLLPRSLFSQRCSVCYV